MPKKTGIVFVIVGAVLLIAALLLFLWNHEEDRTAGDAAEEALKVLQSEAVSGTETPSAEEPDSTPMPLSPEMPERVIDGYAYIGWLSIPALELELPVMSQWDYARLDIAPCRHAGSSRLDNLVIAAHNYASHFGSLRDLTPGAEILFTDMDGIENRYVVASLETIPPDASDRVLGGEYALVLYTCTPGGAMRVAAFCERAGEA